MDVLTDIVVLFAEIQGSTDATTLNGIVCAGCTGFFKLMLVVTANRTTMSSTPETCCAYTARLRLREQKRSNSGCTGIGGTCAGYGGDWCFRTTLNDCLSESPPFDVLDPNRTEGQQMDHADDLEFGLAAHD